MPEPRGIPEPLRERAQGWARLWGVPDLPDTVTVEFSRRFRTSLALCWPAEGRIRLSAHLENGDKALLEEVLCHELAHVAVHRLYGRWAKPHGPEWKGLVSRAGYEPRTKIQRTDPRLPPETKKPRPRWLHRCPVCQAQRIAFRPVTEWRCSECLNAGLSGELIITRLPPAGEGVGKGGGSG